MIKTYLKQPYPKEDSSWKMILFISAFITVFMLIFQPFGMAEYTSNSKYFFILGYGGITFGLLALNLFVLKRVFKKWFLNWTILKEIFWLAWIFFIIGSGNYFYSSLLFTGFVGIKGFLVFQFFTLIIGAFPVVIVTLISHNIKLSQNVKMASEINDKLITKPSHSKLEEVVILIADNNKDKIELALSDLLFIESVGNYIQATYLIDGQLTKTLLRGAIKRIEMENTQHTSLVKCHRAFIVNMDHVESVKGNSQDLKLVLRNTAIEIPVSRNNTQKIKNSLH